MWSSNKTSRKKPLAARSLDTCHIATHKNAAAAKAKGTATDYVWLALLVTAGEAIGNSRWVTWAGWSEPPAVRAMPVGDPSSGKSPALDAVLDPVREIERDLAEDYKSARADWDVKDELARLSLTAWKADAKAVIADGEEAPVKPDSADAGPMPVRERMRVRRTFVDVFTSQGSAIAEKAIRRVAELYAVEKEVRGKPPGEREAPRQANSRRIFDALEEWLRV